MNKLQEYQQRWRRRQRRGKELLLIGLRGKALQVSCWQQDCCLWREERALDVSAGQQADFILEIGESLRAILLAARAAEGIAAILLLDSTQVYGELLTLPMLEDRGLRQAVAWEAGQMLPWTEGKYAAAFAVEERREAELQIRLWGMELAAVQEWRRLADSLQLRLQAILALEEEVEVRQTWYEGRRWKNENLLGSARSLSCSRLLQSPYWRTAALGCMALALLLGVGVRGGCYLARQSVQENGRQMQEYEKWRQRLADSRNLEAELERYRQLAQDDGRPKMQVGSKLEQLGRQLEPGCWLQTVQSSAGQGQWQIEGRAADLTAVHTLMRRWQQDKAYGQVELLRSRQENGGVSFALRLKERES